MCPLRRLSACCEVRDENRELEQGGCEDDRDNACGVDLQRDMGGLAAISSSSLHLLRVLNGNPSFPVLQIYDKCHNCDTKSLGIVDTILIKRMIEIPFPMPRSVICSPIHMMSSAPAVRIMILQMTVQV